MAKRIDMTGMRVGSLEVLRPISGGNYGTYWLCKCDLCGEEKAVRGWSLRHNQQSCGCVKGTYKHGDCVGGEVKRLRVIWADMKARCNNPKNIGFHLYGGRGIKVCDEWQNDYIAFREWALANGYRDDLSIDRIDSNGNYEPSNCRWATSEEQQANRRCTYRVTVQGQTKTINEWAEIVGVTKAALQHRKQRGTLQAFLEEAVSEKWRESNG